MFGDYFLSEKKLIKIATHETPSESVRVKNKKSYLSNITLVSNHQSEAPTQVIINNNAKIIKKIINQTSNKFLILSNIFYF